MHTMRRWLMMAVLAALAGCASERAAQVERFEIVSRAPAYGGMAFDDAGAYETVIAIAHMRINARHPANAGIVDLDKASAVDGWVPYQTDVVIVRPRDGAKASRVLLAEIPNRGGKLMPYMVNEGGNSVLDAAGAGTGYTMRRGHTLVWIGWQGDIALAADGKVAGTAFPVATLGGKPIVGPSMAEAVFDDIKPVGTIKLAWPAATLDRAQASLTVRPYATAPALAVDSWRYANEREVEVTRLREADAGAIYQFTYQARDPKVMGLGFAALRDVTSFLKSRDPANPLADIKPELALVVGVSQSGRTLRDWIWQGFNADPNGGRVFDGAMPLIAGSRKSFVNARFAQPGRYSTQHLDHLTYGDQFPFSYAVTTDPVSGATDGIFARCQATNTCPKLMHVDSSLEFWQARASLVVTDGAGHDIALPDNVRAYLLASTQHVAPKAASTGICKYPNNPAPQAPLLRALMERLVDWTRSGALPPASRYPRLADSRLTAPSREAVGFPDLGAIGVRFPATINALSVVDYGVVPPRADLDRRYELLVPMTDADGLDLAGIRSPDVSVPLATYAGWNLRRAGFAEDQLCGLDGMSVPFAATPRAGDPRPAISQRYPNRMAYAKSVALAARALRDEGLLLGDDTNRFIDKAKVDARVPP